jgi:hypothetical protein
MGEVVFIEQSYLVFIRKIVQAHKDLGSERIEEAFSETDTNIIELVYNLQCIHENFPEEAIDVVFMKYFVGCIEFALEWLEDNKEETSCQTCGGHGGTSEHKCLTCGGTGEPYYGGERHA